MPRFANAAGADPHGGAFKEHWQPGGDSLTELVTGRGGRAWQTPEDVQHGVRIEGRVPAGATGFAHGPLSGYGSSITFPSGGGGGGGGVGGGTSPPLGGPSTAGTAGTGTPAFGIGTTATGPATAGAGTTVPAFGLGTTGGGAASAGGGFGAWWSGLSTTGKIGAVSQILGLGGTAFGLANAANDSGNNVNVNFGRNTAQEQVGMETLLEILLSQGATDQRLLNREITGIARNTEAEQQRQQEAAARSGLTGFQGGDALQAAIAAGGTQQIADAQAREAQIQEQRKRDDLNLLLDLIIGPEIQRSGIQAGVGIENQRASDQRQAALMAALAQLFAGGSSFFNSAGTAGG